MYTQFLLFKNIQNREFLYKIIFYILLTHVVFIDIDALLQYFSFLDKAKVCGLTDHTDKASYITNICLSFILVEFIYRIDYKRNILPLNNLILSGITFLIILSLVVEKSRNAMFIAFGLGILTIIVLLRSKTMGKYKKIILGILIIIVSIPMVYSIKYDTRWNTFYKTIPYAIDTDTYKYWKAPAEEGNKFFAKKDIGPSLYLRLAWFTEGIKSIQRNPYGVGYGRNAFRHSFQSFETRKYVSHSHSGLLDLAIGIGALGVILWIFLLFYLFFNMYYKFKKEKNYYALLLSFIIVDFFTRSIVDSNIRDHMLLTFMLLLGILLALSASFLDTKKQKVC
jgi:O-antigen ligase